MSKSNINVGVFTFYVLVIFTIVVAGISGWVMNLVKIFGSDFSHVTGALVLRIIGVFVFFIGAVLGWIG